MNQVMNLADAKLQFELPEIGGNGLSGNGISGNGSDSTKIDFSSLLEDFITTL